MTAILRKELADYFTSIRFIILFTLMLFVSAGGLRAASEGIRGANLPEGFVFLGLFTTSGSLIPSLISLLALLIPIIGIALGFDAINSERTGGTLSRVLSQPIYREVPGRDSDAGGDGRRFGTADIRLRFENDRRAADG